MKKTFLFMFLIAFVYVSSSTYAKTAPNPAAYSAILIDSRTNKILFSKNANTPMAPASTTKIMTAILALEKLKLNRVVTIRPTAVGQEGSSMYLAPKERKTVKELLYGLMLVSGNDAAVALAEAISGSEANFARLMNSKAKQLGMKNTNFVNASGLPATGHYSTAYDLAILTSYAMKNPTFAKIVCTKTATVSGAKYGTSRTLINHNKLLWKYRYTTGVKPGYTIAAGGCLVSSAAHNGMSLIAVVLKTSYIYDDTMQLFEYGFNLLSHQNKLANSNQTGQHPASTGKS